MAKIIIDDLLDETSFLSDANLRFQQIEDELNQKVLYRDNPVDEPNGMSNDMDMQESNILNVDNLDTNTITINGKKIGGVFDPTLWGEIEGDMADQLDLEQRFQAVETGGVQTLNISPARGTRLGLETTTDVDGNALISFTEAKNQSAGGLVTLNSRGLVDLSLTEIGIVNNLGFIRGDDLCPKDVELPTPPVACGAPDYRNPTERYGDIFNNGDTWMVSMADGEINGSINLINPQDPTGADVPTPVVIGDGIVYLDELVLGGFTLIRRGWHFWGGAVQQSTAVDTQYNETGDRIIIPGSNNVDLALNDLDALCAIQADVDTDNAAQDVEIAGANGLAQQGIDDAGNALGVANAAQNTADAAITNAATAQSTADTNAGNISGLTSSKQDKGAYADVAGTTSGVTRYNYDSQTNTLTIFTQD